MALSTEQPLTNKNLPQYLKDHVRWVFNCHSSTIIFSRTMVQHIMQWQDTQDYITCKYTTMRDRGKRTINEQDINKYSGKYILTTK